MEQPDPWGIGQAIDDAIEAIEKSERYRLEVLQLEAQILALKNRLEEFADAIDFTLDNFSCKTFIPQKFI